jgi:hypothetical protein
METSLSLPPPLQTISSLACTLHLSPQPPQVSSPFDVGATAWFPATALLDWSTPKHTPSHKPQHVRRYAYTHFPFISFLLITLHKSLLKKRRILPSSLTSSGSRSELSAPVFNSAFSDLYKQVLRFGSVSWTQLLNPIIICFLRFVFVAVADLQRYLLLQLLVRAERLVFNV